MSELLESMHLLAPAGEVVLALGVETPEVSQNRLQLWCHITSIVLVCHKTKQNKDLAVPRKLYGNNTLFNT
jgi:hypothetical protein